MPIEWTASNDTHTIEAMGVGRVSAADWHNFIDEMAKARITAYGKIIDLSRVSLDISVAEISALANVINALSDNDGVRIGPAAFVIDSAAALERLMLFDDRTALTQRPLAIFPTRRLALDWLESLRLP